MLGVARNRVVVVPPAVPLVEATLDGTDLVVNITGVDDLFIELAPRVDRLRPAHGSQRRRARQHVGRAADPFAAGFAVTVRRAPGRARGTGERARRHAPLGRRAVPFLRHRGARRRACRRSRAPPRSIENSWRAPRRSFDSDDEVAATLDEVWTNDARRVDHGRGRSVAGRRFRAGDRGARVRLAVSRRRARLDVMTRTITISHRATLSPPARRHRDLRPWPGATDCATLADPSLDVVGLGPRGPPRVDDGTWRYA